jgi:type I restriction enzyme S subunit
MSEWKECKIADAPFEIIDGDRGTNYPKQDEFNQNGYCLFLNAKNVTTDGFAFNECYFISKEKDKILRKGKLQRNDIILTTRGTVGNIGFFNERIPYDNIRINSGMVIIRSDPKGILPEYTHQLFKYLKGDFDVFATGSAQPQLPIRDLKEISFLLPPLPEQRAIADVLSSLDDKIDLLHRQNKTLEGMAEALWRKMFVEEADQGWKKGKLGDLIELCYGKGLKEEKRMPGRYPVLGSSGIVGYHNDFLVKGPGIVIGRKGTLGVVNYVEEDFFPIDTTFFIKSKTNAGKLFFEYFLLKEFSFEEMNSDSAVPGLNREIAESMEFIVPEIDSIYKFNDSCGPLFSKKMQNQIQIRSLSRLRDTLLPKLMSGEVRVKA